MELKLISKSIPHASLQQEGPHNPTAEQQDARKDTLALKDNDVGDVSTVAGGTAILGRGYCYTLTLPLGRGSQLGLGPRDNGQEWNGLLDPGSCRRQSPRHHIHKQTHAQVQQCPP